MVQLVTSKPSGALGCFCCCFSHSAYWLPKREKPLYTVANPARDLWSREKRTKEKVWQHTPPPPRPPHTARSEKKKNHASHLQVLRRSRSVSRPYKDTFGSSTRPMGVASQNSTLPSAVPSFPVSLLLSFPGDV